MKFVETNRSVGNDVKQATRAALRLVLSYAVIAVLWILLSDRAVASLFTDPAQIILASLVQRFRFRPSQPAPHPVMTMTVRPEPGVFLELQALEVD